MSNRSIKSLIPLTSCGTDSTHLRVRVYFDEGGICYATYNRKEKGFYMSVTPVKIEKLDSGMVAESFMGFSGIGGIIEPVTRYNAKKLASHAENVQNLPDYRKCLNHILTRIGGTIEGYTVETPELAAA